MARTGSLRVRTPGDESTRPCLGLGYDAAHIMRIIAFHKPFHVLTQFTDPEGRTTLKSYIDLVGIYAAGRLDYDSEGLLLLTDDGEINESLTNPRHERPKTYWAQVEGKATPEQLAPFQSGLLVAGEKMRPAQARIIADPRVGDRMSHADPRNPVPAPVRAYHPSTWLEIVVHEGRKRQVRRMTAAIGLPCLRLIRYAIGPITLDGLAPGVWRPLTAAEVRLLQSTPRSGGARRPASKDPRHG